MTAITPLLAVHGRPTPTALTSGLPELRGHREPPRRGSADLVPSPMAPTPLRRPATTPMASRWPTSSRRSPVPLRRIFRAGTAPHKSPNLRRRPSRPLGFPGNFDPRNRDPRICPTRTPRSSRRCPTPPSSPTWRRCSAPAPSASRRSGWASHPPSLPPCRRNPSRAAGSCSRDAPWPRSSQCSHWR